MRNASISRVKFKREFLSASSLSTVGASALMSTGRYKSALSASEKPRFLPAFHCIGVREPVR